MICYKAQHACIHVESPYLELLYLLQRWVQVLGLDDGCFTYQLGFHLWSILVRDVVQTPKVN